MWYPTMDHVRMKSNHILPIKYEEVLERVGESRSRVVSTWNTVFNLVLLFIY